MASFFEFSGAQGQTVIHCPRLCNMLKNRHKFQKRTFEPTTADLLVYLRCTRGVLKSDLIFPPFLYRNKYW